PIADANGMLFHSSYSPLRPRRALCSLFLDSEVVGVVLKFLLEEGHILDMILEVFSLLLQEGEVLLQPLDVLRDITDIPLDRGQQLLIGLDLLGQRLRPLREPFPHHGYPVVHRCLPSLAGDDTSLTDGSQSVNPESQSTS